MRSTTVIGEELHKLRTEQATFFKSHTPEGQMSPDLTSEQVDEARKRNEAITDKAKEYEQSQDVEGMAAQNDDALKALKRPTGRQTTDGQPGETPTAKSTKSLGRLFIESDAYKSWNTNLQQSAPFEVDLIETYGDNGMKALFDTSAFAVQVVRLPDVVQPGEQQPHVADLLPQGTTNAPGIAYMEETTTTPGAAETAESGAKPEAALAFTEKTSTVRKIAVSLPLTDESTADAPFLESYINTRLRQFVEYREDQQLLTGDGNAPNIRGILQTANIQTQAKGADPTPDAVYKAMTKIRTVGFLEPTGAVFHPNDWQDIRLLRTVDGIYIWGAPMDAGPERIWGLDVVQTTAETQNTALVGAFRLGAQIFRRSAIAMQVGWVNDQFLKNQHTVILEERLALVVFRPKAFCTVTGI